MNFVSQAYAAFDQSRRKWLAPSSLQFRLTAGITLTLILGLGSVAVWVIWTMQQLLVTTHIQTVQYVADRFPQDVDLYGDMFAAETAVQRAISRIETGTTNGSSGLLIWVTHADDSILAKSPSLHQASSSFQTMLMSLSEMPIQPQVYRVSDRYLVLSSSPLLVGGTPLGQLYVAQDVTEEHMKLNTAIHQVSIATLSMIVLLTGVITIYIRRSLHPLRQLSQLAETISADELSRVHLQLDRAPDEVQELAQMLEKMLARLSQSWEEHRQFVANVSHELRTPLSIISGYLQSLLRRSASFNSSQVEALEIATSEADRTIRLLQDLLDLTRIDSGYLYFCIETIVLNDLIQEVVNMSERFGDRHISIEAKHPAIPVKADRDRLVQVLVNLIDNAMKYSDPHDPIIVRLAHTAEEATIQVLDYGCGIPLQQQARIFERFYRVDEARARSTGGVGLGLAIVKSLVEGMGGHVTVSSKPGQGSTFTVTLLSV